jgi:hypothetical protein
MTNRLYFGDNLHVLREHMADASVDLIYLDPPFNSKRDYNLLFKTPKGHESDAQITAFEDSWHWGEQAEREFNEILRQSNRRRRADAGAAHVPRRERHDGVSRDDGEPPAGIAPGAEADRQPVSAPRSDGEPLFENCA